MSAAKYCVLAVWAYCSLSFFIDSNHSAVIMGRLFFWATAIAHGVEFAMFINLFREDDDSLGVHFAKTMAFGLFHAREVRKRLEASSQS